LADGGNSSVFIKPFGDDVARRQRIEVEEVVGRRQTQGLLDTKSKGAPQALNDTAAQRRQATRQRAA